MEEGIDILEVDEHVESVLTNASKSRETMLKIANQALERQSGNMIAYNTLMQEMKKSHEKYLLLKIEKESLEKQMHELKETQKKIENEVIQLRLESEQNKKKRSSLQSLFQVLLNVYGVHEIVKILGIPYVKLKEYLED